MDVNTQNIVMDHGDGPQHLVNWTGTVLPVPFSHSQNFVGIHWLRISFIKHHLQNLVKFCNHIWGESDSDGYGLWSYDSRFNWKSGVSLNYDHDDERSQRVHLDRMTLDCPGGALDEMTVPDLQLLIEFCHALDGKCSRIDVYFDDYGRLVSFDELIEVAERHDFSGLIDYQIRKAGKRGREGHTRREMSFGKRGSHGNGKYLRWYDKELESDGEFACDRWEVEFTQAKADAVFKKLAETCGGIDSFAVLCGSLVAGSISFIHRTGEKNISRLDRYDWWEKILAILGQGVSVRVKRKVDSLTGKIEWVKRNVSPSLACLKKVFVSDRAFFRWLWDVCKDGDGRMNPFTEQLARTNEKSLDYRWGEMQQVEQNNYDLSQL